MAIKPLDDRVVIKPMEAEEKTAGGILLPDNAKEKPLRGVVMAVGDEATDVKPGDVAVFDRLAGGTVKIGGVEKNMMRESEILGVIEND